MRRLSLAGMASLLMAVWLLAGCGGGGGGSSDSSQVGTSTTNNVLAVSVGAGPTNNFPNLVLTSVTVCVPGTTTCQTIGNVMVDTGSSGLRLLASAVTIALPGVASPSGQYGECVDFADGVAWGTVAQADVQLAGERASSVSVQLIGDTTPIPATCSSQGAEEDTQATLGVNGILGVGISPNDCGTYCASTADAIYYDCTAAGVCTESTIPVAVQVINPVTAFAQDNNGVVLTLTAIPFGGAATGSGNLLFGIGTQIDNVLTASIIPIPLTGNTAGYFTATFNGMSYPNSFFDSGSTILLFEDASLATCSDAADYYCPGSSAALSSVPLSVAITDDEGSTRTVTLTVANADYLYSTGFGAFDDVAGPTGSTLTGSFDFGVPFFFGKSVFTAIEGHTTPYGTGPFVAFQAAS